VYCETPVSNDLQRQRYPIFSTRLWPLQNTGYACMFTRRYHIEFSFENFLHYGESSIEIQGEIISEWTEW